MVDIKASAVADIEAMNRVVLDVDIVDGARSKDLADLDKVVRPEALLANRGR